MPSTNPYQAPATALDDGATATASMRVVLAGRAARIFATLVDASILSACAGLLLAAWAVEFSGDRTLLIASLSAITLVVLALQGALYRASGQTIGKRIFSIRTVRTDGRPASLMRVFALRNLLPILISFLPALGWAFVIADSLTLLRTNRRTLHDLFADTKVVKAL